MTDKLDLLNDIVFSLDIGTRTIIGLVAKYEDGILNVLASETMSHEKRAMYDGQIHDIGSVVKVAEKVKTSLEKQVGFSLEKVAVAAAGRSLEVSRTKISLKVDPTREIDKSTIKSGELEAIREAENLLKEKMNIDETKYYCVGHTVVNYFLDDALIENLEGHKGEYITIDVIATFLPHTVVDSLGTVMNRLNLEIVNMTLEPIAAINVAVKKNLRLLNIALVDIGAGTSDIAITKDGTINSYAMVPTAGDEITETLVKTFLLDYDVAEELKINLKNNEQHEFQDILGITYKLKSEEILDKIDSSILDLSREISEKILKLNEGAPSVVFLIGGGSQIPRLEEYISDSLDIPKERVAIKDTSLVENISGLGETLSGPDSITPVGIAIMSLESNYRDFIEVILNGEKIKLFNIEKSKITDALLKAKFNPRDLIVKRGQSLNYTLNGVEKEVLGQVGEPARVYLNGEKSFLEQRLKNGDEISIKTASAGESGIAKLSDILDIEKSVYLNDEEYKTVLNVEVNKSLKEGDLHLKDGDKITYFEILTVSELFKHLNIDLSKCDVFKDTEKLSREYMLKDKDNLKSKEKQEKQVNKEDIIIKKNNFTQNKAITVTVNGKNLTIEHKQEKFQFVDIFNYIDFDLTHPKGELVLNINNSEAEYLKELNDGDVLEVYWRN